MGNMTHAVGKTDELKTKRFVTSGILTIFFSIYTFHFRNIIYMHLFSFCCCCFAVFPRAQPPCKRKWKPVYFLHTHTVKEMYNIVDVSFFCNDISIKKTWAKHRKCSVWHSRQIQFNRKLCVWGLPRTEHNVTQAYSLTFE